MKSSSFASMLLSLLTSIAGRRGPLSFATGFSVQQSSIASSSSSSRVQRFQSTSRSGLVVLDSTTTSASSDATATTTSTTTSKSIDLKENVILFDGVCNFCNTWVDILLRLDVNERFKFTPLQSETGKALLQATGRDADDISSVVLVKPGMESFRKSACVLEVVKELGPPGIVFSASVNAIVPRGIRDGIYDMVAENRYNLMGKRDVCRAGDPKYFDRFIKDGEIV